MNKNPLIVGITGVKNSGKTTLMEKLIQALSARGLKVASIKHDAHQFVADTPGTDSYRHKAAGAFASIIFDKDKFLLVKDGSFDIPDMLPFFKGADIVLIEGAKQTPYPKLEALRKGNSETPITPTNQLIALMTDTEYQVNGVPSLDINDVEGAIKVILSLMP
ncbi:MAG TPA: molybdopterin-guanine dinucleotide biosynthesis protein B [Clostridiales bacterium]|jgi:molybdopterin-guanine dinucleotide biosynthesis protein B|nr:molybdopterin-guanine dinucleotide biosynthesis protein B [Clostridiales bacterium]